MPGASERLDPGLVAAVQRRVRILRDPVLLAVGRRVARGHEPAELEVVDTAVAAASVLEIFARLTLLRSAEPPDGQTDQEEAGRGRERDRRHHQQRPDVEAQVQQHFQRVRQTVDFLRSKRRK